MACENIDWPKERYKCIRPVRRFGCMVLLLAVITACTPRQHKYKQTFFRLDTITEVTIVLSGKTDPTPIWRSIDSLLLDWEERFSVTGDKSEVQRLNRRTTACMPVSPQLSRMITVALAYGDSLNAGFDLTILPIKEVWGFGEEASDSMPLPTREAVDSALHTVSYKNVRVTPAGDSVCFLSPTTRIDVGGIAKGCVLAEIRQLIDHYGVAQFLVVAGGDIVCKGTRPDGTPWLIGIQDPRNNDAYIGTMPLDSGSVVTSGDYERFRIVDGKRYHHIFDSHTGLTCRANRSVTIYGPDPVTVDILSTGLFCRSAPEIVEYINKRPGFQCCVVDSTGKISTSSGWKGEMTPGKK